jgi:hypothetical protein
VSIVRTRSHTNYGSEAATLRETGELEVLRLYEQLKSNRGAVTKELLGPDNMGSGADRSERDRSHAFELAEFRRASHRAVELQRWLDAQFQSKLLAIHPEGWPQDSIAVDCRVGGDGWRHTLHGWSVPEVGGTWTDGNGAAVVLPRFVALGKALVVRMEVTPFLAAEVPQQRIRILVGSHSLDEVILAAGGEISFYVPPALLSGDQPTIIQFELPDAIQPSQTGNSADHRLLGMLVKRYVATVTDPRSPGV